MKKYVLVILLIIVLAGCTYLFLLSPQRTEQNSSAAAESQGRVHKMVLGEDGYSPTDITIKKGDTIEFSTSGDKPFWPASDIHPTHGIYPEFDPQDAVMPDKTWSFKFEKAGHWRYHDHLYPYFTGKIIVEE